MTISVNNLKTPKDNIWRKIGESVFYAAGAIQPFVASADPEVMSNKAKFYAAFIILLFGIIARTFTRMISTKKEDEEEDFNG